MKKETSSQEIIVWDINSTPFSKKSQLFISLFILNPFNLYMLAPYELFLSSIKPFVFLYSIYPVWKDTFYNVFCISLVRCWVTCTFCTTLSYFPMLSPAKHTFHTSHFVLVSMYLLGYPILRLIFD